MNPITNNQLPIPQSPITDFTAIIFDPTNHTYTYHGRPLTSVTKICKTFEPEFDREGVAARIAQRDRKTTPQILADWDAKAAASRALGDRVHQYIRAILLQEIDPSSNLPTFQSPIPNPQSPIPNPQSLIPNPQSPIPNDPLLALNQKLPEEAAFDRFWEHVKPAFKIHNIEWIVGDAALGLAGTIDACIYNTDTNRYHLLDWKTGKLNTYNQFQKLHPPFHDLDNCELDKYSLQLSLYRLIVERNTQLDLGESYLIHLSAPGDDGQTTAHIHKAKNLATRFLTHLTPDDPPKEAT